MPLFNEDGTLNLDVAAAEVRDSQTIQNTSARDESRQTVIAATLVDIAASLRAIAAGGIALDYELAEDAVTVPGRIASAATEHGPDGPTIVEPERQTDSEGYDLDEPDAAFAVGDWATNDERPEEAPLEVTAVGYSEDEEWAEVGGVRIFTKYLTLVDKAAYDAERERALAEQPDPRDQVVADLDTDFDTLVPLGGPSTAPGGLCGNAHPSKGVCNKPAGHKGKKHGNDGFSWKAA